MAAKRKYNWEDWFSRPRTVIVRGRDYHCSQSAMAIQVRSNASDRRVSIRLTDNTDSMTIEVIGALPPRKGKHRSNGHTQLGEAPSDNVPHTPEATLAG